METVRGTCGSLVDDRNLPGENIFKEKMKNENIKSLEGTGAGDGESKIHLGPSCAAILHDLSDIMDVEVEADVKNDNVGDSASPPLASNDTANTTKNLVDVSDDPMVDSLYAYRDFEDLQTELGEIYGYYEMSSFFHNKDAFKEYLKRKNVKKWQDLTSDQKIDLVQAIVDDCELANEKKRNNAILALNYLTQGCWAENETLEEQLGCVVQNVELMLQCNAFWTVWMVFKIINSTLIDLWLRTEKEESLEGCLSIMCTIMLVALTSVENESFAGLIIDLNPATTAEPIFDDLLRFIVRVTQFSPSCYLLKKILIALRYYILLTLGGSDVLRKNKELHRKMTGLRPSKEDTLLTCEKIGLIQDSRWWRDEAQRKFLTIADLEEISSEEDLYKRSDRVSFDAKNRNFPWSPKTALSSFTDIHATITHHTKMTYEYQRCLNMPYAIIQKTQLLTQVSQMQMNSLRSKSNHVCSRVNEKQILACGLFFQHLHVPLGDFQKEEEKLILKYPNLFGNQERVFSAEIDKIFAGMLPKFNEILESFRGILSEAIPRKTTRDFNDFFVPIDTDPTYNEEDRFRQSEVVAKTLSSILILLLKHFKVNHIYQFEYLAAGMVTVGFIPAMMRFFNRNISQYFCQRTFHHDPDCHFKVMLVEHTPFSSNDGAGESLKEPTLSQDRLHSRNVFTHINLLRILNKLVKGNTCRIRMLGMLNPLESLKRALNLRDPFLQQYLLKLLKILCKSTDQEWKRNNLHVLTAIFFKVRHRLLDEWIGDNISSANRTRKPKFDFSTIGWPWDFSGYEFRLVTNVTAYINRKFVQNSQSEWQRFQGTQNKIVRGPTEPTEKEYQEWLAAEATLVDWDSLITKSFIV